MARWKKRLKKWRFSLRKRIFKLVPDVMHIGRRAFVRGILLSGQPGLEKHFSMNAEGKLCFERELLAQELFGDRPWLVPVVKRGVRTVAMCRYKQEQRLDHAVQGMDEETRLEVARQALRIAWEIFNKGYAHRDFHSRNLFWVKDRLMATDFETLEPYPADQIPAFPESYDVSGGGLPSPYSTANMSYVRDRSDGLQQVLGVPLNEAMKGVYESLEEWLREESLSFQTGKDRHLTKAERIYGSFELPHFSVKADKVQRNSGRRMERFGVKPSMIEGKRVLDLGCHCRAMLLEAQRFRPASSLGIEFDAAKVDVAQAVARFNGLRSVEFRPGDVDTLEPDSLGQKYDVVFCLAINGHVKKPDRLYDLLGRVTGDRLLFEGNLGTDVEAVTSKLREAGFASVTHVGMSDDDCVPKNNNRPMIVAQRHPA